MGSYPGGNITGFVSPAGGSLEGPIDLSEILDGLGSIEDSPLPGFGWRRFLPAHVNPPRSAKAAISRAL